MPKQKATSRTITIELKPGEEVVITVKTILPIRATRKGREFLDMKVEEFFTEERIRDAGEPNGAYYSDMIYRKTRADRRREKQADLVTVRDVVAEGKSGLLKRVNTGKKIVGAIEKVLAHNGIRLPKGRARR